MLLFMGSSVDVSCGGYSFTEQTGTERTCRFCHIMLRNSTTCTYIVHCKFCNISDKKLLMVGASRKLHILEYTGVQNLHGHFA